MIDLITIVTPTLTDEAIDEIVFRNCLQTNSKDGEVWYSNDKTKNLAQQQGIYIAIDTLGKLKAEGSLHKYYNETRGYDRNNYNTFTMSEARAAMDRMLFDKGIRKEDARVYNYEIGLNLTVSNDCRDYMQKMKSIGLRANERELYIDPLYVNPMQRNERMKVTGFRKVRKYYKVYDKVFECIDKKRKVIPEGNILRIETVYRRVENCPVSFFFSAENMRKMVEAFFRDWRTVRFDRDIITPKGTGRAKQQLCADIMQHGKENVLRMSKKHHQVGSLSDWEFRNIREFITKEWDLMKKDIVLKKSDIENEFRQLLEINYTILKNDDFIKQ